MSLGHDWPRTLDQDWRTDAACRGMDPNLFFPGRGEHIAPAATEACASCPVHDACLHDAMTTGTYRTDGFGYRAGTTEQQRYNARRRAKRPRPTAECGTASGYSKHQRDHTEICEPCRQARSEYARNVRARG